MEQQTRTFIDRNHKDFVATYEPLVKRIAFHLLNKLPPSVQVDDLIQSGMIGLLEAAGKYDESHGASFETYAGIRIRGSMLDEIRKCDWTPRSVHRKSREISEKVQQLANRSDSAVSEETVAKELGMTLREYHAAKADSTCAKVHSLDELSEFGDVRRSSEPSRLTNQKNQMNMGPSESVDGVMFEEALSEAMTKLPERERLIMALYYDEEMNLKEIGSILGVSESRICQIQGQAAKRLRANLMVGKIKSRFKKFAISRKGFFVK